MTMMALPRGRAADAFDAGGGGAVNSSMFLRVPGPAERLDTVATISPYFHRLHARHRGHHRDRRLAAAGDHVDVHLALPTCSLQVHRRHAEGADGGGREVDHHHAQRIELARVLGVHIGAGGVGRSARRRPPTCGSRPSTPWSVVLMPIPRARFRPSDSGSMPTIHTGSSTGLRCSFHQQDRCRCCRAR